VSSIEVHTPCGKCGKIVIWLSTGRHDWDEVTRRTGSAVCDSCLRKDQEEYQDYLKGHDAFPMASPTHFYQRFLEQTIERTKALLERIEKPGRIIVNAPLRYRYLPKCLHCGRHTVCTNDRSLCDLCNDKRLDAEMEAKKDGN